MMRFQSVSRVATTDFRTAMRPLAKEANETTGVRRHTINLANLKKAWDTQQRMTPDDWHEWIKQLSLELLRESPSPALRSCSALAERSPTLTVELFNAAFVCCWEDLLDRRLLRTAHC